MLIEKGKRLQTESPVHSVAKGGVEKLSGKAKCHHCKRTINAPCKFIREGQKCECPDIDLEKYPDCLGFGDCIYYEPSQTGEVTSQQGAMVK